MMASILVFENVIATMFPTVVTVIKNPCDISMFLYPNARQIWLVIGVILLVIPKIGAIFRILVIAFT